MPPAKLRRLAFRLDSGSLICCDRNGGGEPPDAAPVVLLSVDDAAEAGRTSHADVLRAQRHLEALYRAAAPRIAAAHEAALAAAAAGGAAPDPPAGLKRLRTDGDKGLDPDAAGTPIFSPGGTVLSGGEPPPPPDWLERCRAMHKTVMDFLGNALPIFDRPVDAAVVPDYYKVVKTPMDLGTILAKLNSAEYTRPSEFATDIRQVPAATPLRVVCLISNAVGVLEIDNLLPSLPVSRSGTTANCTTRRATTSSAPAPPPASTLRGYGPPAGWRRARTAAAAPTPAWPPPSLSRRPPWPASAPGAAPPRRLLALAASASRAPRPAGAARRPAPAARRAVQQRC